MQHLATMVIIVRDYDEAINYYKDKLGFELLEDTKRSETKRWVLMAPKGGKGARFLLAKAKNEEQLTRVGNQTGGRVFCFLYTDDFWTDYNAMVAAGVEIARAASEEDFGTVCLFKDLYGNLWDFIQPKKV